jgi:hypothetical protein
MIVWHANQTSALLARLAPSAPPAHVRWGDVDVVGAHAGAGYGHGTADARRAIEWAGDRLALETTYTGKALAACLAHCGSPRSDNTIVFWNTHNSVDFPIAADLDGVPEPLRRLLAQS